MADGDEVRGEGERADGRSAGRHHREPALQTLHLHSPAGLMTVEVTKLGGSLDHSRQEKEEEGEEVVVGINENSGEPESHPAAKLLLLPEKIISIKPFLVMNLKRSNAHKDTFQFPPVSQDY